MIGRVLGTYKVVEKLGEGGMGAVYKGVDTMLDREVAIKALRPELASQTAIVERFRSEAVTLAKLNHPNIATLYSLFRQGDELFMVLEYVRGETLDALLGRRGALPTAEVIPVFCQILDGINHAHEYGIIHRDIKPANMILTENGILKVLDFGIARLLGTNRMTRAGNIIGTLEYMAPEQVRGLDTDARSDTYALGMLLYEILTGRTPFNTENEFELMKLQTEAMPPNPRSLNSSIPESVELAIIRAIQKDPDSRFQTAGDFREFLLDAGFADHGYLGRTTGPRKGISTPPPTPVPVPISISSSDVVSPTAPTDETENGLKETRLGASVAAPILPPVDLKETRLGDFGSSVSAASNTQTSALPAGVSFFERLTWVHYAGAGAVIAAILGIVVIVPIVIFSGVLAGGEAENTKTVNSNSNANVAVATSTPVPAKEPTKTPEQIKVAEPEPRETPEEFDVREFPTEPGQPEKPPERTKVQPPARKTDPPKTKAPTRSRGGNKSSARCALTGDC